MDSKRKYIFVGLLFTLVAMDSLADEQHYSCEASKSYENAGSAAELFAPGLEEDGALPVSMLCGSDGMKDVVEREKLKAYINGWKDSFGEYTKNTCNRTYWGRQLSTDEEREECSECKGRRFELYDKGTKKHIASIAYYPPNCHISFLSVDEEYRKKGIGSELVKRAIEDMRANHDCREISLIFASKSEKFWEKLGAQPDGPFRKAFPDPSSNLS